MYTDINLSSAILRLFTSALDYYPKQGEAFAVRYHCLMIYNFDKDWEKILTDFENISGCESETCPYSIDW
jgi:hypothetical protein